ncbi:MAG: hypothetical protein IH804_03045 [Planctomycetes bacterium]|nr:hypothetical protein [Planctomycetota bacterium]
MNNSGAVKFPVVSAIQPSSRAENLFRNGRRMPRAGRIPGSIVVHMKKGFLDQRWPWLLAAAVVLFFATMLACAVLAWLIRDESADLETAIPELRAILLRSVGIDPRTRARFTRKEAGVGRG